MEVDWKEGKASASDSSTSGDDRKRKRRRRCMCLWAVAISSTVLAVVLVIVILAFTVFKAKRPVTTVNALTLRDLQLSLNIPRVGVSLNVTLDVDLSIENPNRVGFKYSNSSAFLRYRGDVVGEVPLPAGKIGAGETRSLNLTLTLLADRLLSDSNFYADVLSGTLPLTTYTRIPGKVRIMKLFNIRVVSYTTCDLSISVFNRSLGSQICHYKTKL